MSKVRARSHEITNKPLRVRTTKTPWVPTRKTNKYASDVKKWRIVGNRISKVTQTTRNWIKKILDEVTRIVNVFLISWFFYLLLLCSISLLVKYMYDFILRYEAWENAIRTSSCIENFPQISAKPIALGSSHEAREALTKSAVLHQSFFSETSLENSREFPAKSAVFSANLSPKIPRNLTFFPRPTRSPG